MSKSITRAYRAIVNRHERVVHDHALADPRVATEHRIAHERSRELTGEGCAFCS